MDCRTCGKQLVRRQRMFCSISCRNSANGKKAGGSNRLQRVSYECETCGQSFERDSGYKRRIGGPARDCSLTCHNRRVAAENATTGRTSGPASSAWKGGKSPIYYRKFLKDRCELCGTRERLLIHHRDENRSNSDPANLATWCRRCHQEHHAEPRREVTSGRYERR